MIQECCCICWPLWCYNLLPPPQAHHFLHLAIFYFSNKTSICTYFPTMHSTARSPLIFMSVLILKINICKTQFIACLWPSHLIILRFPQLFHKYRLHLNKWRRYTHKILIALSKHKVSFLWFYKITAKNSFTSRVLLSLVLTLLGQWWDELVRLFGSVSTLSHSVPYLIPHI
jgi:hypothetical protein